MHIVVVGGGFGGITTALSLSRDRSMHVTLISDKDHFVYYPALYNVATGSATKSSFMKLSDILKKSRVKLIIDPIETYDDHRRVVVGKSGKHYSFDRVVFALGVVTTYFGITGLDEFSYTIKSNSELERFKHHLHEDITSKGHIDRQYVIVGAGPTGVELAATLKDHIDTIVRGHDISHGRIHVKLIEAAPRVLPRMSESASRLAHKRLEKLGVKVMVNSKVERQDDETVAVNGHAYHTRTVVWTSGVTNSQFFAKHPKVFQLNPAGKVEVDKHMMVNGHTYVIGDNAATPFSGLAQTAVKDAHFVSKDIKAHVRHTHRPTRRTRTPAVAIPIGDYWALVEWHALRITGLLGYLIRRAADLIGYLDVLPVPLALRSWYANGVREYNCEKCARAL